MPAEPKTRPTDADVGAYLDALEPPRRRDDAKAVCAMMAEVTGEQPVLWGPSIIGFGTYDGATGLWPRSGFAPRKGEFVVYLVPGAEARTDLLSRLGKHRLGVSCLYIRKLSDVDESVLRALVAESLDVMGDRYPAA